jgi:hypothetical protein
MTKGDIVLLPFPFTDLSGHKTRPALILFVGEQDIIVAFITTNDRVISEFDIPVAPDNVNGLKLSSVIKISKVASIDRQLVLGRLGSLNTQNYFMPFYFAQCRSFGLITAPPAPVWYIRARTEPSLLPGRWTGKRTSSPTCGSFRGKLVIHHDPSYQVMTNSPIFDKQLALNDYWKEIGGTVMLPGTNRAADRFVRASFYINAIPQTDDTRLAVASVFSVIRSCSVPFGISTPGQPNISSTRWRTVADHKNKVYYFESALTPNTFWVDFKDVDFTSGASVKKLLLTGNEIYAGNAAGKFVNAPAFKFEGL